MVNAGTDGVMHTSAQNVVFLDFHPASFYQREGWRTRNGNFLLALCASPRVRTILWVGNPGIPHTDNAALPLVESVGGEKLRMWRYRIPWRGSRVEAVYHLHGRLMARALVRAWRRHGFDRPLVWNTSPLMATVAAMVKRHARALVTDSTDNWLLHPDWHALRARSAAGYALAGETSDLVTSTSSALTEFFGDVGDKAVWTPNGVRHELFARALDASLLDPPELVGAPHPRLIWVGILSENIDMDLFEKVCAHFSSGTVICVGAGPTNMVQQLTRHANVRWVGYRPPEEIPAFLAAADVGLVSYRTNEYTRHMAAMKAYEYLAAGLPVVSTPMTYETALHPWVTMAPAGKAFTAALDEALASDSSMQRRARSEAMRACTWDARVNAILDRVAC